MHYGMENMRMQLKMCNGRAAGPKVEGWSRAFFLQHVLPTLQANKAPQLAFDSRSKFFRKRSLACTDIAECASAMRRSSSVTAAARCLPFAWLWRKPGMLQERCQARLI